MFDGPNDSITTRPGAVLVPEVLSTPALIAHIVVFHHDFLRTALPLARKLATKVACVHGALDERFFVLDELVSALTATLLAHIEDEEQWVFPCLLDADAGCGCPALGEALAEMVADHAEVTAQLQAIRDVTDEFRAPEGQCASCRSLFAALAQIDEDIRRHGSIEANLLLPRFVRA